ncbi:hypothetical protein SAMN06265338_10432 [Rhodoblastus acidophilus]|uniref:Uncharacterized protein n=1 Tax=Rhodoblastus acidophilus TaxID=1074 RepID=A0A212REP3_RHOAC|nr:hypothetical protein SAMN06265338_10432 [Rhodoblastus acidophilus]
MLPSRQLRVAARFKFLLAIVATTPLSAGGWRNKY